MSQERDLDAMLLAESLSTPAARPDSRFSTATSRRSSLAVMRRTRIRVSPRTS